MTPRERLIVAGIVLAGLAVRVVLAGSVPLLDGETYYWVWSKTPALSFLDHPPFLAYLIRLTTAFGDGELWVRLGPLIAGVVTPLALFTLGREMFGVRAGLIAAAVFQLVPVLFGAGLFATPETPLFLWWSLALVCARRALWGKPSWWVPAGAAIGLGMLSKMTMVALPLGALGFALTRRREALRSPWLDRGTAIALALFTPVLVWNAGNGWAAVRFVLHERPQQVPVSFAGLVAISIEQLVFALALAPVLLWMVVPALRRRGDDRLAFLLWMILPTLVLLVMVVSIWGGAHGYWAGPAYLGLAVVLGGLWPGMRAAIAMGINAAVIAYATVLPLISSIPAPPGMVESVAGWREVATRAEELATGLPAPAIYIVDHFEGAAQLAYHTRRRRPVTIPKPPVGSVWSAPSQLSAASAVWVVAAEWRPTARPEEFFSQVIPHAPLPIVARGREVRRFRFWTATGPRP
ncbi:MAG: glycosyltransferase family 39 protein [Armatimonadota bacterium]